MWVAAGLIWLASELLSHRAWLLMVLGALVLLTSALAASAFRARDVKGPDVCRRCGYAVPSVRGSAAASKLVCPECGADLTRPGAVGRVRTGLRWRRLGWAVTVLTMGIALAWFSCWRPTVPSLLMKSARSVLPFEDFVRAAMLDSGVAGQAGRGMVAYELGPEASVDEHADMLARVVGEQKWWLDGSLSYRVREARVERLQRGLHPAFYGYPRLRSESEGDGESWLGHWNAGLDRVDERADTNSAQAWERLFRDGEASIYYDSQRENMRLEVWIHPPLDADPPADVVGGYDMRLVCDGEELLTYQMDFLAGSILDFGEGFSQYGLDIHRSGFRRHRPAFSAVLGALYSFDGGAGQPPAAKARFSVEFKPRTLPLSIQRDELEDQCNWVTWPLKLKADPNTHVIDKVRVFVDGIPLDIWHQLLAEQNG